MFRMNYFQFLGEISKYFTTIGITGTNGKSSTTALALYAAQDLPEFGLGILGALVPDFDNESFLINPNHKSEIK
jgi:UDP-N-acetylmuramate-alanine ligase